MRVAEPIYQPRLDAETVRRLSRIRTEYWLWAAFCDWVLIGGAIWVCQIWPYWPVYLGAIVLIGTRQHALGVLVHEGVHYRVASPHFWNDFLSDYLAGYPLLTPTAGYRAFHLKHHQLLDTAEDPERITIDRFPREWSFPMPRLRFLWLLLRDLSGLWPKAQLVLSELIWNIPGKRTGHIIRIALLHVAVAVLVVATGSIWSYLLLWWLPLITVFPVCFRFRTVAEHSGIDVGKPRYIREAVDILKTTRTTITSPLGRFLLAPHNVGYHMEHHLYSSVPYYRLPELAKILWADPEFAANSHISRGYWGVMKELTRVGGSGAMSIFSS